MTLVPDRVNRVNSVRVMDKIGVIRVRVSIRVSVTVRVWIKIKVKVRVRVTVSGHKWRYAQISWNHFLYIRANMLAILSPLPFIS